MSLNESIVEDAALEWFRLRPVLRDSTAHQVRHGPAIARHVGELAPQAREVGHGPRRIFKRKRNQT